MVSTAVVAASTDLTAADRCDRCGAAAQSRVVFSTGDLLLCGHHMRQHADAIAKQIMVPRAL